MYGTGHDLFPNTRLPCDQDRSPGGGRDPRDLLSEPLKARRGSNQAILALVSSVIEEEMVHHAIGGKPDLENLSSFRAL